MVQECTVPARNPSGSPTSSSRELNRTQGLGTRSTMLLGHWRHLSGSWPPSRLRERSVPPDVSCIVHHDGARVASTRPQDQLYGKHTGRVGSRVDRWTIHQTSNVGAGGQGIGGRLG